MTCERVSRYIGGVWALLMTVAISAADVQIDRGVDRAFAQRVLATYVFVGSGSGVLVSPDGLVLTNHHVIDDLEDFTIRFANGVTHPSKLLGTDPVGDIALLHITGLKDGEKLPFAPFAPVEAMRVGAEVVAIGNPFGLGDLDDTPTFTAGVLSAARIVRGDYTDAIQGDAPVNPGNSGGPLFDRAGQLLGINGQIRTVSGFRVNSGIGLAIASTQLSAFLPLLEQAEGGYVHHTAQPKGLELKADNDGVLVIKPGDSPFSSGDRLLTIAGRPAQSVDTARGLFASLPYHVGAMIPVTARRAEQEITLQIPAARQTIPGRPYHGIEIDERGGRIVVDHLDDDSPASDAKLLVGEQVLKANDRELKRKIDWLKAVVPLEIGDRLTLVVKNKDGAERTVTVRLRPR
ncbi:MAG TPA: trypsin-like peptidase domain-containing protein [Planctomycetota bacterium]|nr:trypsin-like peptidase domain-containing protein [Planctomycetota bacterium]